MLICFSPGWYGVLCPVLDELTGLDTIAHAQAAGGGLPAVTGHTDDDTETRPVRGGLELNCNTVSTILSVTHQPPDQQWCN